MMIEQFLLWTLMSDLQSSKKLLQGLCFISPEKYLMMMTLRIVTRKKRMRTKMTRRVKSEIISHLAMENKQYFIFVSLLVYSYYATYRRFYRSFLSPFQYWIMFKISHSELSEFWHDFSQLVSQFKVSDSI